MPSRQQPKTIGQCCNNKLKFAGLYNNEPLDNFIILLCVEHAFSDPFTKNVIKVTKLVTK